MNIFEKQKSEFLTENGPIRKNIEKNIHFQFLWILPRKNNDF